MTALLLEKLEINWTFFVQFGIFLFTFFWLATFFFRPYGRLIRERAERTVKDKERAEGLEVLAKEKSSAFELEMSKARAEANRNAAAILEKAKAEEARVVHAAREAAKQKTQEVLSAVQTERLKVVTDLEKEVEPLAGKVAEVLLR